MEKRDEGAKVGAGGTGAWLLEEWGKARKRDQAVVLALRRNNQMRLALAFILGGVAGTLFAAAYFSTGG